MNFFVLTVTDESDMLADSCGREGRLQDKRPRCTKRVVDSGLWGSGPPNNVLVSHRKNHDDALTF